MQNQEADQNPHGEHKTTVTDLRRDTCGVLTDAEYGPVVITRRGQEVAVLISAYQWAAVKDQVVEGYKQQDELLREHWAEVGAGLRP